MRHIVIVLITVLLAFAHQEPLWGGARSSLYEEGVKLLEAGKYPAAIEKLKLSLQSDSHKAQTYAALGKALFNERRVAESRHAFEAALKIESGLVIAQLGIAMIEASSGNCGRALSMLETIEDKVTEVDEKKVFYRIQVNCDGRDAYKTSQRLAELIRLEGDQAQVDDYLHLWKLYTQTEQPGRALEVIRKVLTISDTAGNREKYGITLFNNGQIEESIAIYKKLIRKHPRIAAYHMHLAKALTAKEAYGEAKREIGAALSLEPANAGYYLEKAIVEFITKEYDQCIESAQVAIDKGDDGIKAKALLFSGECLYGKGDIAGAVKRYNALIKKYPKADHVAFAKKVVGNITRNKTGTAQYLEKVPFIKKRGNSSLSTSLDMVLQYWSKKFALSKKDVHVLEFDGRVPSFADAWLLLKGKEFETIITANDLDVIKTYLSLKMPVIIKNNKTSTYKVITGYDERKKVLYYNDPEMHNRVGQLIYDGWNAADDSMLILMHVKLKNLLVKEEKEQSQDVVTGDLNSTIFKALIGIMEEKDGFRMAKKVSQRYPKVYEAKLVMAEKLFGKKEYKKAIAHYDAVLSAGNINIHVEGLSYLKMAVSYARLGDMVLAKRYLTKAKKIDPEAERNYEKFFKK